MLGRSLLLASLLTLSTQLPASAAVKLHWPLPENSLARNGTPQKMMQHTKLPRQMPQITPLPNKGLHPKAAAGLKRPYSGTAIDVLQYHNDNYPTGWNQSETDLTPANVGSASFGQLTTLNVDGNVIAQPLMVSNFQMPDGLTHNVLIVATGHDTVYAFDAQDYSLLWKVSMGKSQSSNDVGCGDVVPEYGISSTPVIVRNGSSATIYLVAATEPAHMSFHTQIHALDVGTGADVVAPREIDPQAKLSDGSIIHFDPQNQWSRTSLLYGNGTIYVGIGSHCDNNAGDISGWMIRYKPSNLRQIGRFNTIEAPAGYQLSSIWMAGYPSAMDANGFVYSITGNGNYNTGAGKKGYGETVLKLTSDLKHKPADWFTPSNYQDLNNGDTDFGSGGAMLIPLVDGQTAPPLLVGMGKASTVYLLDTTNMGRLEGRHGSKPLQEFQVGGGCWCGPAYYAGASGGVVYYQAGGDELRAFSVETDSTPKLKQIAHGTTSAGYGGSFPVVSSNGSTANTALVWLIRRDTTEQLEAYDAGSLGAPLFAADAGSWNTSGPFLSPLVANGRVYVGAYKTVTVFGLTE
ncbi:MAG TPA: hypothetical protein VLV55_05095 [Rhizomicrobium sp.]|nr:hypothetical protein [Rhizomicrobium sp.]